MWDKCLYNMGMRRRFMTNKDILRNVWLSERCDNCSQGIIETDYLLWALDSIDYDLERMTEEEAGALL